MLKTICLDFDGVMNTYTGWKGEDELFNPRPGLEQFLTILTDRGYSVVVHSTRSSAKIDDWLDKHNLTQFITYVSSTKPKAVMYVDDRGFKFTGDFGEVLMALTVFKTHWEE
jgi:hypothetical protein